MNSELKLLTEQCNKEIEEIKKKYKLKKQEVRERYKNQKKNNGKAKKYMNQHNIPISLNFLNKNTFNINTSYKFDRGILINEILGMPKQRQNRFQMEY